MVRKIESIITSCPVKDVPLDQIDEKTRKRMEVINQRLEEDLKRIQRQEDIAWAKAKLSRYK